MKLNIKKRNTWANLCKNIFYPATIKNDNGTVAMRFFLCDANGNNNYINFKKGRHRGIEDLLNCDPMFLFLSPDEIGGRPRYTKWDP